MKLRFLPVMIIATAMAAPFMQGCIISQCDNGQSNCTQIETATRFEGPVRTASSPYTAGQGVKIIGVNGDIKVTQGTGATVDASFKPFVLDKKSNESGASSQMQSNLVTDVSLQGNIVVVQVSRKSGSSSSLGGDITVTIPAGFSGSFEIAQSNGNVDADIGSGEATSTTVVNSGAGDVTMNGAGGRLKISADVGDVGVGVAVWDTLAEDGSIQAGNGDISLGVPATAIGSMSITASGTLTKTGVPSTWVASGESANQVTYTMGAGGIGGHLVVNDDFGNIGLTVR